ncbi:hypothetical protein V1478_005184 [Vespula squamosa]|uniref:Uncharacterized protein n=1 Tax=Vespula squamosa TaxID=30214 RepID=A0ABD2BDE8_VESSQ
MLNYQVTRRTVQLQETTNMTKAGISGKMGRTDSCENQKHTISRIFGFISRQKQLMKSNIMEKSESPLSPSFKVVEKEIHMEDFRID